MKRSAIRLAVGSVIALGLTASLWAGEEKIDLAKAPAAVQEAIKKAVGTAKLEDVVKETEDGKTVYEAEFEVGDVDHSVKVSEAGAVLEEEMEVDVAKLPAAVVDAVKKKYAAADIEDASEVKAGGKTYFELSVEVGKEDREIKIDAAGTILADKVEADEGDEKDEKGEQK